MATRTRGTLLHSITRANDGSFDPMITFSELSETHYPAGMNVGPGVVRLTLPLGTVKREKGDMRIEILRQFVKAFPGASVISVRFPEGRYGDHRFVDLENPDPKLNLVTIAEKATKDWTVGGKQFEPGYFLGASLPAEFISVDFVNVPHHARSEVAKNLQDSVQHVFESFATTPITIVDVWEVEEEFMPGFWTYANRLRALVRVEKGTATAAAELWPGYIYWTDLMELFTLEYRNRFDYCRMCRDKHQCLEERHLASEPCPFVLCARCKEYGHVARHCTVFPDAQPASDDRQAQPPRPATALTSAQRAFPHGLPDSSAIDASDSEAGESEAGENAGREEGSLEEVATRATRDRELMPPPRARSAPRPQRNSFNDSMLASTDSLASSESARTFASSSNRIPVSLTPNAPSKTESKPRFPSTVSTHAAAPASPPAPAELGAFDDQVSLDGVAAYDIPAFSTLPAAVQASSSVAPLAQSPSDPQRGSLAVSPPSQAFADLLDLDDRQRADPCPPPVVATWNVHVVTPHVVAQLRERTPQHGIDVWLIQEWRSLSFAYEEEAEMLAPPQAWQAVSGRATAIILTNRSWEIIDEFHSDLSSVISVRTASGSLWSFASIYMPADKIRRARLMISPEDFRVQAGLDRLLSKNVVGGDLNIHSGPDWVARGWTELCNCLSPLDDAFTVLHPFSDVGTYLVERTGRFKRLDYIFAPAGILDHAKELLTLAPAGASDHHIVVLIPLPSDIETLQDLTSAVIYRSWRPDPQVLRQPDEQRRLWLSASSLAQKPSWLDWLQEVARIRGHLFNRSLAQPFKSVPSRREVTLLRDRLDEFVISNAEEAREFAILTGLYQIARLSAFPEERQDVLRIQRELPLWPSETRTGSQPASSLSPAQVVQFFKSLYSERGVADSAIPAATTRLLTGRRKWVDTEALRAPFTAEEVQVTVSKMRSDSSPGHAGIPLKAFECAPQAFFDFAAKVATTLCHAKQPTRPTILGTLLFKSKPGNQQDNVAHYRPISVLDTDRKILHSLLAARIAPQLVKMVPANQTGFIPGRSLSSNVAVLALLAEANQLGWLSSPIVVLEQDQEKAYDRVEHRWRDRVLEDLDTPAEIIQMLHNLYGEASIRFQVGELSEPVPVRRGFLQGAADSPLWYTLVYQPMLDAYEASKTGIAIRFGDEVYRLGYMAYADNSYIFLASAEDAKAYWSARSRYDLASGARLNERESSVTVLWPPDSPSRDVPWVTEFCAHFTVRAADESFFCLGRTLRMSAAPAEDAFTSQISKKLRPGWGQMGRFLSLFGKAHLVNNRLLSQIWFVLEAVPLPNPVHSLYRQIRRRLQPLFRTTNGRRVAWRLVCVPRQLGGLGLLDPTIMVPATFAAWTLRALADHLSLGAPKLLRLSFERWLMETHRMTPALVMYFSTLGDPGVNSRNVTRLRNKLVAALERAEVTPLKDPGKGLLSRMLDGCLRFPLSFDADFDWSTLTPSEAAALPWWHSSYVIRDVWKSGSGRTVSYCITEPNTGPRAVINYKFALHYRHTAQYGLQTFADMFWLHPASTSPYGGRSARFVQHVGPPARALDIRRFKDRYPAVPAERNAGVDTNWPQIPRMWLAYMDALPPALVARLREFVQLAANDAEPVPRRQPFPLPAGSFPWRSVKIVGKPVLEAKAKDLRLFAGSRNGAITPTYAQTAAQRAARPRPRLLSHEDSDVSEASDVDDDEGGLQGPPLQNNQYASIDWSLVWPRTLECDLSGAGHDAWWLLLHGKAEVIYQLVRHPHTKCWQPRSALCPFCGVKHSCQHAYLECPRVHEVWRDCWGVLRLLITPVPDWQPPSPLEILQGFPTVEGLLPAGFKLRFRSWFALTVALLSRTFASLQRRVAAIPRARLDRKFREVPRLLMRDLLSLAAGDRAGPQRFSVEDFQSAWLVDGRLFTLVDDDLSLSTEAVESCSTADSPSAHSSGAGHSAPCGEAAASAGDDFVDEESDVVVSVRDVAMANLRAPRTQEWLDRKLHCRCCSLRRRIESNSRLCPVCWAGHFPEVPMARVFWSGQFKTNADMSCDCGASADKGKGRAVDFSSRRTRWDPPASSSAASEPTSVRSPSQSTVDSALRPTAGPSRIPASPKQASLTSFFRRA